MGQRPTSTLIEAFFVRRPKEIKKKRYSKRKSDNSGLEK